MYMQLYTGTCGGDSDQATHDWRQNQCHNQSHQSTMIQCDTEQHVFGTMLLDDQQNVITTFCIMTLAVGTV